MNDKVEPEPPDGRLKELRGADLRNQDLRDLEGRLLPEHVAGADLTRAKLPDDIANFPALHQVAAISGEARKVFIGLLAACVYSWLVVGTTTDVALILNTASSPLPIINTPIPIAGFYVVGAAILTAVYCYLHFYLQRLWRALATLPAVFPDGVALDDKTDPWLLTNLVRLEVERLRPSAPPLARLENLLAVFLAWWLVPLTLLALWIRYLPSHSWLGTTWLVLLIGFTMLIGRHTFVLAKATLGGEAIVGTEPDRAGGVLSRSLHDIRRLRPEKLTVVLVLILTVCSISAFYDNPRDGRIWVAEALNFVGIRTYADLREAEVAKKPGEWNGEDWEKVERVDLRGQNFAFADLTRSFLANADLREVNLRGAFLVGAELQGATFYDISWFQLDPGRPPAAAKLQGASLWGAKLQNAVLANAQLQGALLGGAELEGADLTLAQLQGADLNYAQLQGTDLSEAQLQGANLWRAQLQGADLSPDPFWGHEVTQLQGAELRGAQLQGANLRGAWLQGADLRGAQLQGADLRGAAFWRALVSSDDADWYLADLRGSTAEPMTGRAVDGVIAEVQAIGHERQREQAVERLAGALQTNDRPARPEFPGTWQSQPNVMFQRGDPKPDPVRWGETKWSKEGAYDENLGAFLGNLACNGEVQEAGAQGLARRALVTAGLTWGEEGEPQRLWPLVFAKEIAGPDCAPAKGLPDNMRRQLEKLTAQGDAVAAAPQAPPPPDPVE